MDNILNYLEQGVRDTFNTELYRKYLQVCTVYPYSLNNIILILTQFPQAYIIKSYVDWKKCNASVKKNGKENKVIIPRLYQIDKEVITKDEDDNETLETITIDRCGFTIGYVFDITQTTLEKTPTLAQELTADSNYIQDILDNLILSDKTIKYNEKLANTQVTGYYDPKNNAICLRTDMASSQKLKTLIHESAHRLLHKNIHDINRRKAEVEAESYAYVVSYQLGLDTLSYSFGYVASYSNGKLQTLNASLERIKNTSQAILSWIISAF